MWCWVRALGAGGFPNNSRAALYIIWGLPNRLEGLENPPAIVCAQFAEFPGLIRGAGGCFGTVVGENALCAGERKGGLWRLIHACSLDETICCGSQEVWSSCSQLCRAGEDSLSIQLAWFVSSPLLMPPEKPSGLPA